MELEKYVDTIPSKHWGWNVFQANIYKDIFDDRTLNTLEKTVRAQLSNKTVTYATHRTTFNLEGSQKRIVSHKQNGREQQVVYDITFDSDYWHQTNDTIKAWSDNYIRENVSPVFYKYLKFFEGQQPFSDEPNCWIPFRLHINVLTYTKFLLIHMDSNDQYYNTNKAEDARAYSLTFYFENMLPEHGGEIYTDTGFSYRPQRNSAVCINGNGCLHGVAANMNPNQEPRLAFTVRWAHKDDLYLPGHPNKTLYKLDFE